jgi:hypothetical protein
MSRNNSLTAAQVADLIDQVATEIATEEGRLRHLLIELVTAGNVNDAVTILADWDSMAAGDVLKKHEEVKIGEG